MNVDVNFITMCVATLKDILGFLQLYPIFQSF